MLLASNKEGIAKTKEHIKPNDKIVVTDWRIKNPCALFDNNSLLSLTLTHSLKAKFGKPILAKNNKQKYYTKYIDLIEHHPKHDIPKEMS